MEWFNVLLSRKYLKIEKPIMKIQERRGRWFGEGENLGWGGGHLGQQDDHHGQGHGPVNVQMTLGDLSFERY